jgi:hypothetical protein
MNLAREAAFSPNGLTLGEYRDFAKLQKEHAKGHAHEVGKLLNPHQGVALRCSIAEKVRSALQMANAPNLPQHSKGDRN